MYADGWQGVEGVQEFLPVSNDFATGGRGKQTESGMVDKYAETKNGLNRR